MKYQAESPETLPPPDTMPPLQARPGAAGLDDADPLFPQAFMPSELRSGRYPIDRKPWLDSRYLQWIVVASSAVAMMVLGSILLRIFQA